MNNPEEKNNTEHFSHQVLLGFVTHHLGHEQHKSVIRHIAHCKECLEKTALIYKKVKDVCAKVVRVLPEYIDNKMPQEEQEKIRSHIHVCDSCRTELARLCDERVLVDMPSFFPLPENFPSFADALKRNRKLVTSTLLEAALENEGRGFLFQLFELNQSYKGKNFLSEIAAEFEQKGKRVYLQPEDSSPFLDFEFLSKVEEPFILINDAPRFLNLEYLPLEVKKPIIATGFYPEWTHSEVTYANNQCIIFPDPLSDEERNEIEQKVKLEYDKHFSEVLWRALIYICALGRFGLPVSISLIARILGQNDSEIERIIAEVEGKRLISRVPQNTSLLLATGGYYAEKVLEIEFKEEKETELEKIYRRFIQNAFPDDTRSLVKLIHILSLKGQQEMSRCLIRDCKEQLSASPFNGFIEQFGLARISSKLRLFEEAEGFYNHALTIYPENVHLLHSYAKMLGERRDFRKAEEVFKRLAEKEPKNLYVWQAWGDMEAGRTWRHWKEARTCFRKALEINEGNIYSMVSYGNLERKAHHYEKAEEWLQKALTVDSENLHALCSLGMMERGRLNYEDAANYFDNVLDIDVRNIPAINAKGGMEKDRGHIIEAEKFFKRALEIDSHNLHSLHSIAEIMSEKKIYNEAESLFQRVIELDSSNLHAYISYGLMKAKRAEDEEREDLLREAEDLFKKAEKIDENNPYLYSAWAGMLVRAAKIILKQSKFEEAELLYEKAEELFKRALEISGKQEIESVPIYNTMANMWSRRGRVEKARSCIEISLGLLKKSVELMGLITFNTLAKIEDENGNFQEAEKIYQQALDLDQNNAYTHRAYAYMLRKAGKEEEAKKHFSIAEDFGLLIE